MESAGVPIGRQQSASSNGGGMSESTSDNLSVNEEKDVWVGFDLGGTKMLAAVYDADFNLLGKKRKATRGHEGSEAGIERVHGVIAKALEDAEVSPDRIAGIGIGAPGPLDLEDGIVLDTPNLGWKNVPVQKELEEQFDCPAVLLNDVDAGVYGESRFGAARKARCVVGLFPGTGIGGGCVIDGEIFRGSRLSCFEVGHMRVVPDGPRCGCGRRGCLEAVASRLTISAQAAASAYRGQAPHLKESTGTDLSDIRSGALAASISAGDKAVEDIVRAAARHLGTAAGSLINLLNPDVILLGGGLVEALPELYSEVVAAAAQKRAMECYRDTFKVCVASLGDYASVQGAAAWARHTVDGTRT
jgi:glucokinase